MGSLQNFQYRMTSKAFWEKKNNKAKALNILRNFLWNSD